MADKKTLIEFLEALGFTTKNKKEYSKTYKLQKYTIKADVENNKIYYRTKDLTTVERQEDGQIQLGDKTTSNFTQPENLVVLECVDRLLEKGYLPNDIHLERRYPSGRGASGGKSDVCVYGKDGKSLLVIECKTWGVEFEKEKKKMEEHGGQLFAYLANDQNAKFLVLYASRLSNTSFDYENLIVQVKDREEDLKKSTKQIEEEGIKLYRDANNKGELYEVWKESFSLYFHFNGIFDDDANAYSLELKALKKKNLKPLDDSQGLFNKFAEILRHNNISDNANAFNKILSLFLCKIVDEEKKDEDVLDFQVKEDEEYEHLIDRLQALYQKGMKKLNEEIVYYSEKDLHKIIKLYPKQTPIEQVEEIFRQLKYYTDNEFAFKEVHNKKLFIQNGRVLTEIVKLFQNFRFRYSSQEQVLGDFFELMLNHGVKQSEGQFFTPIPIAKYIILSLGFENLIQSKLKTDEEFILPKILDYACGAGHFLTESIEELQNILKNIDDAVLNEEQKKKVKEYRQDTAWAKHYIFGIEKDYRLARTSQIACFLNGDGDANIIFGDGLEDHNLNLEKKKFDVVIANPPYSVEAFKNYLNVDKTHFDLFEHLTDRSSQIEVLFVERTKQVLAEGGLAGIVLPSTILSTGGSYSKAREVILKYFEVKAITELGNKTFIATGTTTVILFLKRRSDDFLKDREYIADDVFNNNARSKKMSYLDSGKFLSLFIEHRGFDEKEYSEFLKIKKIGTQFNTEIFKEYRSYFDQTTEIKKLLKKPTFIAKTKNDQTKEIDSLFYDFCKKLEKEKFLFFMLCLGDSHKNPELKSNYYEKQKTIIVNSGNDVKIQKEFLGYEFQGKKGQEGIRILNFGGKMFDPINFNDDKKASFYNRKNILSNNSIKISNAAEEYVSQYNLVDLVDFENIAFEKQINTKADFKFDPSKYFGEVKVPLKKLTELSLLLNRGKSPKYGDSKVQIIKSGQIRGYKIFDFTEKYYSASNHKSDDRLLKKGDLLINSTGVGTAGRVNLFDLDGDFVVDSHVTIFRPNTKIIDPTYALYCFSTIGFKELESMAKGSSGQIELSQETISEIKLPIPSFSIQSKISNEIQKISAEENDSISKIEALTMKITKDFADEIKGEPKKKIGSLCLVQSGGTPKRDTPDYWNGDINWLRSEVCQNVYVTKDSVVEKITAEGLKNSSAKILEKDTVLIALVGATIGKVAYLSFESTTNQNVAGIKPNNDKELLPKFLFYALMNDYDKNFGSRKGKFTMANLTMIRNLEIPVPPIDKQKEIIKEIDMKEKELQELKDSIANVQEEKEAVIKKYLE